MSKLSSYLILKLVSIHVTISSLSLSLYPCAITSPLLVFLYLNLLGAHDVGASVPDNTTDPTMQGECKEHESRRGVGHKGNLSY